MSRGAAYRGAQQSRAERMREHVEAWQRSGTTMAAYCRKINMNAKAFEYWRRKFARPEEATNSCDASPLKFVPVTINKKKEEDWYCSISAPTASPLKLNVSRFSEQLDETTQGHRRNTGAEFNGEA